MDGLAPPLKCLLFVRLELENGHSLRQSLISFCKESDCDFSIEVNQLLFQFEKSGSLNPSFHAKTPYRQCILKVFLCGLRGQPILGRIKELEQEVLEKCSDDVKSKLAQLPLISLIPLLLFQFPAFLLLMFGPILESLIKGFNQ